MRGWCLTGCCGGILCRSAAPGGALHTIRVVGGEAPYRIVESPDAGGFDVTPQSVLVFSGDTGTPALFVVTMVATDGDAASPKMVTMSVEVSVYAPVRVAAGVTQTVSRERTGAVAYGVGDGGGAETFGMWRRRRRQGMGLSLWGMCCG